MPKVNIYRLKMFIKGQNKIKSGCVNCGVKNTTKLRIEKNQSWGIRIVTISIQFNKNITSNHRKMSDQNIFLDENTYFKKVHNLDQLIELSTKSNPKDIARHFTTNQLDFSQMKQAISHQIEKVIDNVPPKHKFIIKQKIRSMNPQKKNKNGKFTSSIKDHNSNTNTELENSIIDFFDMRENQLNFDD